MENDRTDNREIELMSFTTLIAKTAKSIDGKEFVTRIHEHQLSTKKHDPLSPMSVHMDRKGPKFNFENVKVIA